MIQSHLRPMSTVSLSMIPGSSKPMPVHARRQCASGASKVHPHAHRRWKAAHKRCGVSMACCDGRMTSAEVARTITSLISYGTLSTINDDGAPLGTFVTFVLDNDGCPLLRLRADAVHTANLKQRSQCTLFAHAAEAPARQLARVTLLGSVEALDDEEQIAASARHAELYRDALGVDAPHPEDTFMRLKVDKCFFVSGLGTADAEQIDGQVYQSAQPDELKDSAARMVAMYNSKRQDEVLRLAASEMGVSADQMLEAEFIWIDTKGVDFHGDALGGVSKTGRYSFPREALDELDALSLITMAAQVAWENERTYVPTMPDVVTQPVE
eukprot:jgi/Ulvmu1/4978/UM207_0022.1